MNEAAFSRAEAEAAPLGALRQPGEGKPPLGPVRLPGLRAGCNATAISKMQYLGPRGAADG